MAWQSAELYKSIDAVVYAFAKFLPGEAAFGYATTALATYARYPTWDDTNTVDIQMRNGATLASAVDDAAVLNGGNAAVLGSEILQFKTVTDLGGNKYRLSRLLRGRRGSEGSMSHGAGAVFVLLSRSTISRVGFDSSEIGILRHFKAVSNGRVLATTAAKPFICNGASLKPYAPVHIRGSRDGSNNLTITWVRRTRTGGAWRDYVDVPLGEETESYSVDILNGATVVRTLTATSETATYTAAQQTTDFGSTQASVAVKVYQISSLVGRGFPGSETI